MSYNNMINASVKGLMITLLLLPLLTLIYSKAGSKQTEWGSVYRKCLKYEEKTTMKPFLPFFFVFVPVISKKCVLHDSVLYINNHRTQQLYELRLTQ